MASSKDKAIALKDNYVAGLIEAGATAPMPTMPEQDMGEQASAIMNLDNGVVSFHNDGDPSMYIGRKGVTVQQHAPNFAYPLSGQGAGAAKYDQMSMPMHRQGTATFNGAVELDNFSRRHGRRPPAGSARVFYNRQ